QMIQFLCPYCNQPLHAPDETAGRNVACSSCRNPVTIPSAGSSSLSSSIVPPPPVGRSWDVFENEPDVLPAEPDVRPAEIEPSRNPFSGITQDEEYRGDSGGATALPSRFRVPEEVEEKVKQLGRVRSYFGPNYFWRPFCLLYGFGLVGFGIVMAAMLG